MRSKNPVLIVLIVLLAGGCSRSPQAKEARFMGRGKEAMQKKDYNRAALEYLNAVKVMPRDAEAYYQLGLAYLAAHNPRGGVQALRQATELNPKHVDAQLRLSTLLAGSRDMKTVEDAQKRLSEVLPLEPQNVDILDVLALTSLRLGKPEEAEEELEQALAKFPAHLQSSVDLAKLKLSRKDLAGAQQALQDAVKAAPQSAEAALALGRLYLVFGKPEQGQAEVRRALKIDPRNGAALLTLAAMQFNSGHADDADRIFQQISQLPDPNYKPMHAAFLFRTGKLEAATAEFEKLAKGAPDDRAARTRLVAAYASTGQTDAAERLLKEALKKNPKDTQALLQRSQLYLSSNQYAEAETDLRQVLHFQTNSPSAHYYLSRVFRASGNRLQQRQELTEALRLNRDLLIARIELARLLVASNGAGAALEVMNETPDAQKKTIPAIVATNWALMGLDNRAEARQGVNAGLARAKTPELLLQDAVLKLADKDPAGARVSIDEALSRQMDYIPAWEFLGQTYAVQKQPQKAVERLQQAVRQRPQAGSLQLLLGRWLMNVGKFADARAAFEAAKKADAKSTAPDLALARLDAAQGSLDRARQDLASVVAAQPQNTAAHILLGEIAEKAGDRTAAIAQYREVVAIDRNSTPALNNLAFMLSKDDPDEALKYAQQAGELAPDNPAVQDTLGWALYRKGDYEQAVRYLKTAVEKGGTPRREYHLGMAYLKTGSQELGQKMLSMALGADPSLATSQGW